MISDGDGPAVTLVLREEADGKTQTFQFHPDALEGEPIDAHGTLSPDGSRMTWVSPSGRLKAAPIGDPGNATVLAGPPARGQWMGVPVWSDAGNWVAYPTGAFGAPASDPTGGRIHLVRPDGRDHRVVFEVDGAGGPVPLLIEEDTDRLWSMLEGEGYTGRDVQITSLSDGSTIARAPSWAGGESVPQPVPGTTSVLTWRGDTADLRLLILDLADRERRILLNAPSYPGEIRVDPTGRIAVVARQPLNGAERLGLRRIDLETDRVTELSTRCEVGTPLSWDRTGRYLALGAADCERGPKLWHILDTEEDELTLFYRGNRSHRVSVLGWLRP